jgi:hypothetical protein
MGSQRRAPVRLRSQQMGSRSRMVVNLQGELPHVTLPFFFNLWAAQCNWLSTVAYLNCLLKAASACITSITKG